MRRRDPDPKRMSATSLGICFCLAAGILPTLYGQPAAAAEKRQAPATVRRKVEGAYPRHDQPDAARQFYRLKRQPLQAGDQEDPQQRYATALAHLSGMPVHSLRLGGMLPAETVGSPVPVLVAKVARVLGTWEELGPGNIGGRTRVLVIRPDDPAVMYSGGVSGGLWQTADGGQSWQPMGDRLANLAINALAIDPVDPDVLWAGTGEGYFREEVRGTWLPLRGAGIFRTGNGGRTWSRLPATETADFYWINDLQVSPRDRRRLYAATRTGVWRSVDAGGSWQQILAVSEKGGCLDLVMRSDGAAEVMLASCGTLQGQTAVYRSADTAAGEPIWEVVLSEAGQGRTSLAIAPSHQDIVYALAASNVPGPGGNFEQGLHAVFRSDAGGVAGSWRATVRNSDANRLNTLLLTNPVATSYRMCGFGGDDAWVTMGWYVNVIAVDPVDPDIVWAGGVDLFRSDDGGANWGLASQWWNVRGAGSFVHADQHAIVFHPDYDGAGNRTIFATNDGGIYTSSDARLAVASREEGICIPEQQISIRWQRLNHGYGVTQFYHGAVFPDGTRYLGGAQDNGTIVGGQALGYNGWHQLYGGDGGYVAIDHTDPRILFVSTQWAGIVKSTNGGLVFQDATIGLPYQESFSGPQPADADFLFITPFVMDPSDPQRLWLGGRRLWTTDDGAAHWFAASSELTSSGWVSAVAVAPDSSNLVVAGTSEGQIHRHRQATTASAESDWPGISPRAGFVSWLAFAPHDSRELYATFAGFGGNHVWHSSDDGDSWQALDGSGATALPDIPVHCIVVDPRHRQHLYLGTDLGVFTSVDGGDSWAVESTGFANTVTESLILVETTEGQAWLYAFTHGRGAWRVRVDPPPPSPRRPGRRVAPG